MRCHSPFNLSSNVLLKPLVLAVTCISIIVSAGCTQTVSENVSKEGHVATSDLIFPNPEHAWQKQGTFPNSENLSKIQAGVSKDDLYQLIGVPHFNERQHAQEWDYIFKFPQADGSIQKCQYKIIFDSHFLAQEFYWQPADCAQYAQGTGTAQPVMTIMESAPPPLFNEKINLSADALFEFNKWRTHDMTPQGRQSLDELATKLREYQNQGDSRVVITGYTDYLGDDRYNLDLSQLRAQTVREYLIAQGVDAATMVANGAGEASPIKQCASTLPRPELIDCLQPNRRVEVAVAVYAAQ